MQQVTGKVDASLFSVGGGEMFEETDHCIDNILGILAIEKIRYDHTGAFNGMPLDSDFFPEAYYDALDDVAPSVSAEADDYDSYIQKFCFPDMREYYRLCREYGRKHKVSFQRNPFVKEAKAFVNDEMCGIDSYCIEWMLFTPKTETEKKWPCLAVFTSVEFYQPVQLVESLFNIRSFYKNGVKHLKTEMEHQTKIVSLPAILPETERKQAA